ncbi:MAG: 2,3-diphosphoglycerate-dependent phosphoglycerate mutase [Furfurilactobacillus sp.]|jgi:2,3-bisphosphoglycerate-dependent phosphoglycerate mutase|uniref:2,3-bisphosphoglycerate-dependent phosphoglycerate mutase n=2 Tax=Furfurilactobacillus TaxID=2767882 RepID=A0A0R1RAH0_9LACO|nr:MULTISPECIES: 2,3-diphosphoglycerate-dependent phosphoglycerate mutase [Furfurilactobacillus]KRL53438.1 phosphoglyceromutase [Furfurilactobacillus rossiae DSM 15814]MCF6160331.1 2,3-diphosphoglycerate-dependent phosphoglycerate mutase [Furfurilactobacillus milii]MCF6162274.1 2,3-diphosphoglycerate-dependent phosphoglycerate mutase [Furfurilactobacillus milii]MCF6166651.1 2,3-diphosphoglycerate-dependent phosphoglycerate mutase [Furfurilactobacillus rossiae]MCF6420113.1 2,3-diphosphoglycerat
MAKLVLIRHGQSQWNLSNQFTGWVDVDLSDKGVEEAKHAGQLIKEHGLEFDYAFTSVLTRAIKTLHYALEESDQLWVPETKTWRLNERHYGALQGQNKAEAAKKWGDDQVHTWRRSYDVLPPLLSADDEGSASKDRRYANLDPKIVPGGENLKVTLERVMPLWEDEIAPKLLDGKNVIIAAHGNSLRALSKYIENISDEDIVSLEMATGEPVVYDFNDKLEVQSKVKLDK